MYTVRRPVDNVYLVREPDRRRTRELLALLLSPLPPLAVLFAAVWTNLETFRLGYQIESLQKQKESLAEKQRQLEMERARVSALAQSVAYSVATAGPLGAGAVFQLTGSWTPVLIAMIVLAVVQVVVGIALSRATHPRG